MCSEGLNARIQAFTYGDYIEKFKVKICYYSSLDAFLLIDLVKKKETLELFDYDEDFGRNFLYHTNQEVKDFLGLLGFHNPQFTFELNMVNQYAH